jgi:hypothetical protein
MAVIDNGESGESVRNDINNAFAELYVIAGEVFSNRGDYDASGDLFPSIGGRGEAGAILKGDRYRISVAGTLGGVAVVEGQEIWAKIDNPGQTSGNWAISTGGGSGGGGGGGGETSQAYNSEISFVANYGSYNENAHTQLALITFSINWIGAIFGTTTYRKIVSNGDAILFPNNIESVVNDSDGLFSGLTFVPTNGSIYHIIFKCSDVANQKFILFISQIEAVGENNPELSNFEIVDAYRNRIYFDSSEIITGSTYAGFTIANPSKTITGITINANNVTGHYFTVDSDFLYGETPTILYSGTGSDIENDFELPLEAFTAVNIVNSIGELIFQDHFTDNDGVVLEAHTPILGSAGDTITGSQKILTNELTAVSAGYALWNFGDPDIAEEIYFRRSVTSGTQTLYFRWLNPASTAQRMTLTWDGDADTLTLREIIGGVVTQLGQVTLANNVYSNFIKIVGKGTNVKVYVNNTLQLNVTTNIITGNYGGAYFSTSDFMDNLEVYAI